MKISYDPAKRAWTREHRALDFEDSVQVFAGPTVNVVDDRTDYGEHRTVTYGFFELAPGRNCLDAKIGLPTRYFDEEMQCA